MTSEELYEALEAERKSADAGLSPMMGEWEHVFRIEPVPHAASPGRRAAFRKSVQDQLRQLWLYSGEIHLEITIHVDTQTTLETDETADLDNYAKVILDALKGSNGVFIDDSQVQSLSISWLERYGDAGFTTKIRSCPDDFILKPVEFYEMPDGLWYPQDHTHRDVVEETEPNGFLHYAGLGLLEMLSSVKNRARAELRKSGANRLQAYQRAMHVVSSGRGFHRSRIEDGGFLLHTRQEWQAARRNWQVKNPGALDNIERIVKLAHENYLTMIMLAGRENSRRK